MLSFIAGAATMFFLLLFAGLCFNAKRADKQAELIARKCVEGVQKAVLDSKEDGRA